MTEKEIQAYLRIIDMKGDVSDLVFLTMLLDGISPVYSSETVARELIDRYGTLVDICDAPLSFLSNLKGVGPEGAKRIKLCRAAVNNILRSNTTESYRRTFTYEEIADVLRPKFVGAKDEMSYVLLLSSRFKLLHIEKLGEGNFSSVALNFRKIVRDVCYFNADRIAIAHNHNHSTLPSDTDIVLTNKLNELLDDIGVELVDHIIFCENKFKSMRKSGYIRPLKREIDKKVFPD